MIGSQDKPHSVGSTQRRETDRKGTQTFKTFQKLTENNMVKESSVEFTKKEFHNCSCVLTPSPVDGSKSVSLGQCPRGPECSQSFTSYMAVSVLSFFINSLGTTPAYMVILRCITPELKSLALGVQTLMMRTLGGITAPVYYGAFIDSTCLKWGMKKCEGRGACRMYDSDMFRVIFLGLFTCLNGCSYVFAIAVIVLLRKQFSKEEVRALQQTASKRSETELQTPNMCISDGSKTDIRPTENTTEITHNSVVGQTDH